uniref:Peptidase S1 domain-containing protein n=1 Tax=Strigamia maritima TaxID=126957 RepID=T1IZK1_STRMM
MGPSFHWPVKLRRSNKLWIFVCFILLEFSTSVKTTPRSSTRVYDRLTRGLIRPLSCNDNKSGETGICMFTLYCFAAKGKPLTTCKDGTFLGSCCQLPPHSELDQNMHDFSGNDLSSTTNFQTEMASSRWKSSTPLPSSSVVTTNNIRTTLSDIEIPNEIQNSSPINSSWRVTSADSSSTMLLSLVTRKPIKPLRRTTPKPSVINWAVFSETKNLTVTTQRYRPIYHTPPRRPGPTTTETIFRKTTMFPESAFPKTTVFPESAFPKTTVFPESAFPKTTVFPESAFPKTTVFPESAFSKTTVFPKTTTTARRRMTTVRTQLPIVRTTTTTMPSTTEFNLADTDFKEACGRTFYNEDVPTARIVGGKKAIFGKWPWQVSLRQWKKNTFQHKCGAALLNENWAISAAHCVDNVSIEQLQVRIGDFDVSNVKEELSHADRQVQVIFKHPDFNPRNFENDLALIRFYEPIHFQRNIIPICIPSNDNSFVNDTAYVTGWGRLYEDGPLPEQLYEAQIPIISNLECEKLYQQAGYIESIPDIFICAGRPGGGIDSCEGDSGGPMVIRGADQRWTLAGVISWGIGCAEPNQPGVYTRISRFRDWVNKALVF